MTNTVTLTGYILVADDDIAMVEHELPRHIELTRQETGCLRFEITRSEDNPNRWDLHEEFIDESAFTFHQQRTKSSSWGRLSGTVERHFQIET